MKDKAPGMSTVSFELSSSQKPGPSLAQKPKNILDNPTTNGLRVEKSGKHTFVIVHESGAKLPFVLQGQSEAREMKFLLAELMIRQETCREVKRLENACKTYVKPSLLDDSVVDTYMNDNKIAPGTSLSFIDSEVLSSEKLEKIIQGNKYKHSLEGGTSSFANGISTFLNSIQSTQVETAKVRVNQVAQK